MVMIIENVNKTPGPMTLHTEVQLERDICTHLGAHGWLYAEPGTDGDARSYDTPRALYPPDLVAWLQATQPDAWDKLTQLHGAGTEAVVLERLRKALDDRGTLDVLRHGLEMMGLRKRLDLAQFKPALAMNAELQARYAANRLRVLRQVRTNHDDIIDLVLLLNGIPVATAEIKTDFTQDVNLAIDQYRFDRIPRPKGKASAEPLLDFPRGATARRRSRRCCSRATTSSTPPASWCRPCWPTGRGRST